MYTDFYSLKEKPFNLTPSSRFLYLGEVHKEALALLTYGVVERKGFILLTGEVGTGKTTMVQALLNNLSPSDQFVHISNPLLSSGEFMDYLAFAAFKKKLHFKSKADFLIYFESFLKECLQHQKNFLLIIDEAQALSYELLEEIRLLSNMETADEKLINIFLVGQPELNEKLSQPRCKALLQRISVRYHIRPLSLDDTGEYISTRLKIAGARDPHKILPKDTVRAIHECSKGYPRMINILADNAMLLGYSRGIKKISPLMVRECYRDLLLEMEKTPQESVVPLRQEETQQIVKEVGRKPRRYWKWAAVFFLIAVLAFGLGTRGKDLMGYISGLRGLQPSAEIAEKATGGVLAPEGEAAKMREENLDAADEKGEGAQELKKSDMIPDSGGTVEGKAPAGNEIPSAPESQVIDRGGPPAGNTTEVGEKKPGPQLSKTSQGDRISDFEEEKPSQTLTVKKGDTLTELAANVYGWVDDSVIEFVRKNNPGLRDVNRIEVGQKIVFPPLSKSDRGAVYTVQVASFKPFSFARDLFQKLTDEGYEAYIIPVYDDKKGKVFRVTLGNFKNPSEAQKFAAEIKNKGLSDYAQTIQVEMK
jgi:type II secretory pathway predicted ATPase ExeA/phage tail protein X